MISEMDGLSLDPETHRILSSANLRTFNALLSTSDLELYRLFRNDILRVKEVREAVAREMARLGYWKPRRGETGTWLPDMQLRGEISDDSVRGIFLREQEAIRRSRLEREQREQRERNERLAAEALERKAFRERAASVKSWFKWLGFSKRVQYCLIDAKLLTIEAIARISDQELLRMPNFGKKSLREVRAIVPAAQAASEKPRVRVKVSAVPDSIGESADTASGVTIWRDLVPRGVAMEQESFERARSIWQARHGGATLQQVASGMKLSVNRIRQLEARAARIIREHGPDWSPVDRWISISGHNADIAKLSKMVPVVGNGRAASQAPAQ